jgi:Flp pilus assembly pilin Flp
MATRARVFSRFTRARDGVTAVEFALLAPVLMLMMFGIIEFSLIMVAYNTMEGATAISSRLGKTGYTASGLTRQQTIINAIDDRAGSLIDISRITVASKFYKQYDQINDPEPYIDANGNSSYDAGENYTDINGNGAWDADMGSSGYGSAGDVVVYTVSYPWALMTPIISRIIGNEAGAITITTHAVVKNEPY